MPPSIKSSIEGDIVRGTKVTFTIQDPPQDINVKSWVFEETLESGKKVKVTRPKNDSAQTWNTSWEGQMVTSGKIIVKYQIKKKLSKGKWEIKKGSTLEHEVKVVARTGDAWRSTVTLHDDQPTSTIPSSSPGSKPKIPPQKFPDLGRHHSRILPQNYVPQTINLTRGPNRGYSISDALQIEFHSYGYINDDLRDANSDFSKAQDGNAYFTMGNSPTLHLVKSSNYYTLSGEKVKIKDEEKFRKDHDIPVNITSPAPKRPIDKNDWTVSGDNVEVVDLEKFMKKYNIRIFLTSPPPRRPIEPDDWTISGNTIKIVNEDDFREKYNIGDKAFNCKPEGYTLKPESYKIEPPRIRHADLLKYTKRHEYAGNPNSHRANFEKLVRALDPKAYAESIISRPGTQTNLINLIRKRVRMVGVDDKHRIVDEEATKNDEQVRYVAFERIYGCNEDDNGNFVGNVWNTVNNRAFPSTQ